MNASVQRPSGGPPRAPRALWLVVGLVLALSAALPLAARADTPPALEKLGRGASGVALGVLEIPGNVVQETRLNGVGSGLTAGFARGLGRFVTRELVGLGQILTAPFADPAALDSEFAAVYPWDYFRSSGEDTYLAKEEEELGWIRGVSVERKAGMLVVRFPSEMLFSVGSYTLGPDAKLRLRGLAETLNRNPGTSLLVQGHTDATGSAEWNARLSYLRAEAVRKYLIDSGLDASRIATVGHGESYPVASNDTPDGRQSNRRVEFLLHPSDVAAGEAEAL